MLINKTFIIIVLTADQQTALHMEEYIQNIFTSFTPSSSSATGDSLISSNSNSNSSSNHGTKRYHFHYVGAAYNASNFSVRRDSFTHYDLIEKSDITLGNI
jgi:hypothetical protein